MTLKFKTSPIKQVPVELIFWIIALTLLAVAEPQDHKQVNHFSLCPLANLGLNWCPGCGLGRAITQFFHGNLTESIRQHWFGIPAVLIIGYRIVILGSAQLKKIKEFKIKDKEDNYV